ncbi:hypothetical protein MNBD_GAMMA09-3686 [hydrothermal vent metagenome]|uniref:Uncharacterized protein n=1 Tax=hydrothermal vent metagenome TaxID=652676 RepID=A0A3B0XPK2_9ZZZZ
MTYMVAFMIILETPVFTKQITALISDDSYTELQQTIRLDPEAGDIISASGGLRKIRWQAEGRGKRGGYSRDLLLACTGRSDLYVTRLRQKPANRPDS